MTLILYLSQIILPFLIFYIIACGLLNKIPVYDCFIRGARKGLHTVSKLTPTMIGLILATGLLRASGFLDFLSGLLSRIFPQRLFPAELIPLAIIRMFSSSAAVGLLLDIFKKYGTDSYIGYTASLMMCCTETIFYTMSVYFSSAHIKKTRYTLPGALLSTFAGIIACIVFTNLIQ